MVTKRYAGVAAARHLNTLPREPQQDTCREKRAGTAQRPLAANRGFGSPEANAHRKKRMVALVLSTLVGATVPALITLLVLFG